MTGNEQRQEADDFRALHHGSKALVLANIWDAGSAVLAASLGFPALATTSAGVAWGLGYPDGERMDRHEMLGMVERIAKRVAVPVSADMERGYGTTPDAVADTVRRTLAAGAVGINLEDSVGHGARALRDRRLATECIVAARRAAGAAGIPLVINARTDVYFDRGAAPDWKLREAVGRANAYLEAGADCAFIIGVPDAAAIGELVREINGPINIIAGSGGLDINGLAALGVKRISLGGSMTRAVFGKLKDALEEVRDAGTLEFLQGGMTHDGLDKLFET